MQNSNSNLRSSIHRRSFRYGQWLKVPALYAISPAEGSVSEADICSSSSVITRFHCPTQSNRANFSATFSVTAEPLKEVSIPLSLDGKDCCSGGRNVRGRECTVYKTTAAHKCHHHYIHHYQHHQRCHCHCHYYSLFTLRKSRSPLILNGE